jgi:SAM-dependent methyltransferase
MLQNSLDENYWNNRYQQHQTGWDIGTISIALKAYIDQLQDKNLAILIPGCGNAHEAAYLLDQGFTNITLIDIAPAAVAAIQEKLPQYVGKQLHIICGDFFELQASFDLILEQTFFCALDPLLRNDYVQQMFDLLKAGGKLVGVLFNCSFESSPPFGGSQEEYIGLFSASFSITVIEDCYNSIAARAGNELFFILKKEP